MKDPDVLLAALWAEDEPPARDPAFIIAVMEATARRRFRLGVLALLPLTGVASAVFWALGPVISAGLGPVFQSFNGIASTEVAAALTMAVFLWAWGSGRLIPEGG